MKKILSIVFVLIALFLFSACGEGPEKEPTPEQDPVPVEVTKYTVTFKALDKVLSTQEVESGKAAVAPTVEIEGYNFKGWDKEFNNVTSDLVVNAILEEIVIEETKYVVRFLVDGVEVSRQEIKENEGAIAPADPVKEGYDFKGWDKDFSKITSNLDINAKFEKKEEVIEYKYYTVEFLVNGKVINTQQVKEGESAILPEQPASEDGKYFGGWRKDTSNVTSDMRVAAIMQEVNLEGKDLYIPMPVGKCELTYFCVAEKVGTEYLKTDLQQTKVWLCPGYAGLQWWYRVLINVENGDLKVIELVDRGKSSNIAKCDYCIYAYTDEMSQKIIDSGVQVGDIIQFSTHPSSFYETGDIKESFTVKRYTETTQYELNNDVSHTVIALNNMQKKFDAMGVITTDIELPTYDTNTKANISWESSNPSVLSASGELGEVSENTTVVLKAVAVYESSTYYWTYELVVGPKA